MISVGLLAGLVGMAISCSTEGEDGPVEVLWDRVRCHQCAMLVGDPSFAAQSRDEHGQWLFFDDPGCFFKHVHGSEAGLPTPTYFHHISEDRWIPLDEVGFIEVGHTPMGYGLGAVDESHPDALPVPTAIDRITETLR